MFIKRGTWETVAEYEERCKFCEKQVKTIENEKKYLSSISNQELASLLQETQHHCGILGIYSLYMNEAIFRLNQMK